jgi:hypothetical protein
VWHSPQCFTRSGATSCAKSTAHDGGLPAPTTSAAIIGQRRGIDHGRPVARLAAGIDAVSEGESIEPASPFADREVANADRRWPADRSAGGRPTAARLRC